MEILDWLRGLGLERYEPNFADNDVDTEVLNDLTDADLERIGVGHRKKFLKAMKALGAGMYRHQRPVMPSAAA